ncbi:MAG: hypothetical protein ACRDTT_11705, partial [Pseudonocardiaceae bacterium]
YDVRPDRVLPFQDTKDPNDEKHVHPLQRDVIARYCAMRVNPGERVLTPFMGVGSEVFEPVRYGCYGIGIELKPSYYRQAVANMAGVDDPEGVPAGQGNLFDEPESGRNDGLLHHDGVV